MDSLLAKYDVLKGNERMYSDAEAVDGRPVDRDGLRAGHAIRARESSKGPPVLALRIGALNVRTASLIVEAASVIRGKAGRPPCV